MNEVCGILIVDKPAGMTSHDVVDKVRRLFKTRRVGHTGTLDPDATGVLVICLGTATRLAEYLSAASKHYTSDVVFGRRTDTMDASGTCLETIDASRLTREFVLGLLPRFRGKIHQMPPMVSARHHEGKRLYELAREGITVERQAREVEISQLDLVEFVPGAEPRARLEITCSTGTYIRVLADDLGAAAGTGAFMQTLRRTWVGTEEASAFTLAESHTLPELEVAANDGKIAGTLISLASGLRGLRQYALSEDGLRRLRHGQSVAMSEVVGPAASAACDAMMAAVVDQNGEVVAIAECGGGTLRPLKVLMPI